MDLSTFLLAPMQRITRYPLLIKQILRYTEPGADHEKLEWVLLFPFVGLLSDADLSLLIAGTPSEKLRPCFRGSTKPSGLERTKIDSRLSLLIL